MNTPPGTPKKISEPDDDSIPELMPMHWPWYHIFGYVLFNTYPQSTKTQEPRSDSQGLGEPG